MTKGDKLANCALQWLNTPYVHNAKIKGVGVDCARLVVGACEDAELIEKEGLKLGDYSNEWHLHRQEDIMQRIANKYCVEVHDLRRGDILLFKYGRVCSHAAIYLGDDMVIHSYIDKGTVISSLKESIFYTRNGRKRLQHVYRFV